MTAWLTLQRDASTAAPESQATVAPTAQANLPALVRNVIPIAKDVGADIERMVMAAPVDLTGSAIELLIANGHRDESKLTDIAFWMHHPDLTGEKLNPRMPGFAYLSKEWTELRSTVVHPALAAPKKEAPAAKADKATAESVGDRDSDKYFTQAESHYRDVDAPRGWQEGGSHHGTCNTASLTMALVSMAGESEVRAKIVGLLKSKGMHAGAAVEMGKDNWLPIDTALDDPKLLNRIPLIDLVTAAAVGKGGVYEEDKRGGIHSPGEFAGTLARVARESGIAAASDPVRGQPELATERGLTLARKMLAAGNRVLAGTVNHYVYLLEVRDDGALIHDPAGARLDPEMTSPIFLNAGPAESIINQWANLNDAKQAAAQRRVSTNPDAAAIVNRLVEIWAMPKPDRTKARTALAKEHRGQIVTGARNFYASSEFAAHHLRLMVSLTATA